MLKVKVGSRGQIVIPKLIRDSLGISKYVGLIIRDKEIIIKPLMENVVDEWGRIAKEEGCDVEKDLIYGDRLYREVF